MCKIQLHMQEQSGFSNAPLHSLYADKFSKQHVVYFIKIKHWGKFQGFFQIPLLKITLTCRLSV